MANYFCDTTLATGNDDGTTTDDAWRNLQTALQFDINAGDKLWIRRVSGHTAGSDIAPTCDGTVALPCYWIGAPRTTVTGTGDFTQGSRVISDLSITPDLLSHGTRMIKNDTDTREYMISAEVRKISYDTEVAGFTEGAILTGGTSGAKGKIHRIVDNGATGDLYIVKINDTAFNGTEDITDDSGGDATSNTADVLDGFLIMNPYVGANEDDGNFTIAADDDYAEFAAIDDSLWTIKIATWNADSHAIPEIDFDNSAFQMKVEADVYTIIKNVAMKDSTDTSGLLHYSFSCVVANIEHCIFRQIENSTMIRSSSSNNTLNFINVICRGNATGASQHGITINPGDTYLTNVSIYNCGDGGLFVGVGAGIFIGNNVNIGIATPNEDDDIALAGAGRFMMRNVNLGGKNGQIETSSTSFCSCNTVDFENFDRTLDNHEARWKRFIDYIKKLAVSLGTGDPEKRAGGADFVIQTSYTAAAIYVPTEPTWKPQLIHEYVIVATTDSKSYRFYVQAKNMAITDAAELYVECEYVDQYLSDTVYHTKIVRSDETVAQRDDAGDWDKYIEVTGIQPAIASKVYLRIYATGHEDADGEIYIDPLAVVS